MSFITVTPAYGRDYSSAKDAKAAWNKNIDFIINSHFHPYDGKPINKAQADADGLKIQLRFNQLKRIANA